MNNLDSLLTQNVASIIMAGAFLWYLTRKDEMNKKTFDGFNETFHIHLQHLLKTESKLTKTLQSLTNIIEKWNNKLK